MLVAPNISARIVTATYSGTVIEVTDDPNADYFYSSDLGGAFSVTFTYDTEQTPYSMSGDSRAVYRPALSELTVTVGGRDFAINTALEPVRPGDIAQPKDVRISNDDRSFAPGEEALRSDVFELFFGAIGNGTRTFFQLRLEETNTNGTNPNAISGLNLPDTPYDPLSFSRRLARFTITSGEELPMPGFEAPWDSLLASVDSVAVSAVPLPAAWLLMLLPLTACGRKVTSSSKSVH